ncbi:MAG: hypothetical protein H6Q65_2257 [Firmicutes bacterium]|nr:hypothetical protein [Bacillota bacterium]
MENVKQTTQTTMGNRVFYCFLRRLRDIPAMQISPRAKLHNIALFVYHENSKGHYHYTNSKINAIIF